MKKSIFLVALTVIMGISGFTAKAQYAPTAADVKPLMVGQEMPDKIISIQMPYGSGAHGLLGLDFFEGKDLRISFRNGTIRLNKKIAKKT